MSGASSSGASGSRMHRSGLSMARIMERDAPISVWIDFENCAIHPNRCLSKLSCHIVDALRELGYCSNDISITAYGEINFIPDRQRISLQHSGITLVHVDHTGKDAADHKMLLDFWTWAQGNRPPANLLIISGDTGFWPTMNTLRMHNYNIMMACRPLKYTNMPPANTVMCLTQLLNGNLSPAQIELTR